MGSGSPRIRRSALTFLDARYVGEATVNARQEVLEARNNDSPLRGNLQVRSDFGFVDEVVASLQSQATLSPDTASFLVREVILDPGACLMRKGPGRTEVLHSVIFERGSEDGSELEFDLRVTLRATIRAKRRDPGAPMEPPEIETFVIEAEEVDLEDDRDAQLLLLGRWLMEYRTEGASSREPPQRPLAFLGKPTNMGAHDVPDTWRTALEGAAEMFGYRARVQTDSNGFTGRLDKDTEWVFTFDPALLAKVDRGSLPGVKTPELTDWGASFNTLLLNILRHLREAAEYEEEPEEKHELLPGEIFFHRKVGDSKGGHDNFSDRSAEPICSHESNWRRFHGDKSRKGMARIYENFSNEMLYHCGKFPNCNVYQVRG